MKAMMAGALIGLWFALLPIPTWAASLPPGVSDQVTFSGTQIGNIPLTYSFDDSAESQPGFFQIQVGTNVTIPSQTIFNMSEPCGDPAGCPLSDTMGFTSTPSAEGGPNLTFSLLSDSDLSNLSGLSNCVEGSQGCGIGAFVFLDNVGTTVLKVDVSSDPDLPGVPEPSTLLLVGPSLAGLAVWGRKTLTKTI